jgi:hypothetical protein
MSLAETAPADMSTTDRSGRIIWIAGWALAAVILIAHYGVAALNQDFSEPDNAMRLVRVRDFLAGQGWFDSVEHRLNPPDGTPMHWARWIDAALAAPMALLTPVLGQHGAEIATAFVWPLGLLALFMVLVVRISGEIGAADGLRREAQVAGAIVAALAFPAIDKFSPGSFDHHNVELVLCLLAMLGMMRMHETPRAGAMSGIALAVALATAAEAVPTAGAAMLVAGLLWMFQPRVYARALMWLGAGLAVGSGVMFATLVPPGEWARPVCDAMSTPFLAFGLAGGAAAAVLGIVSPQPLASTLARRMALAAVLGAVALTVLVVLFPECARGGYSAMTADMKRLWMNQISESRSLAVLAKDDPWMMLGLAGAALAGLVAAAFYLRKHWRRAEGWIVLGFLLSAWVVLAWQIRGATFATAFAIPFGAWAVAKARRDYRSKASTIRLLAFAGIAVTSAAAAWASAGGVLKSSLTTKPAMASYESREANSKACMMAEAFKPLDSAPEGVLLNQFVLGPSVLLWTQHSVLAGPYHRDVTGTMMMIDALRSSPEDARSIVTMSVADYVLICPALPETGFYARNAKDGVEPGATLSAKLAKGEHPDWLEPVVIDGPLKLYRVIR